MSNNYGYPSNTPAVPENSDDPRKQVNQDRDLNIFGQNITNQQLGIGGGLLGTAAALGLGAFAIHEYQENKEEKADEAWGAENWLADARRRQTEYVAAVKENKDLPPVQWVLTENEHIPSGAIKGGQDAKGNPLYIARAYFDNAIHIGSASTTFKDGAHIAYKGKQREVKTYEVLLGFENAVRWVPGQGPLKNIEGKPVEGGRAADGTPIYIGQGHIKNTVVPGSVSAQLEGCACAYDDDEKMETMYRYLTYSS
ncbi:hypothetical protein HDU90_009173 [Geranomyces variabilis]|nr:hypothetical protein HDU90_009173 [Geranomyces variabilis]